jgi:predicted permease
MSLLHLPLPTPLLAEISGAQWIAIAAILGGILLTSVIVIFALKFVQRRQELWHETARVALEKGQPLPPLPHDMQHEKSSAESSDIRTGLILIAVGAGLYFFFISMFGGWMKYMGAIPGFIGVALLLYGLLNALFGRKQPSPADRPTQS